LPFLNVTNQTNMKDTIIQRSLLLALACSLWLGFHLTAQGDPLAQSPGVSQNTTDEAVAETNPAEPNTGDDTAKVEENESAEPQKRAKTGIRSHEVVSIGKSVEVKPGDTAGTVVVVGGSATIDGNVEDTVVAIGGDVTVNGEVSDTVVSVLGNIKLGPKAKIGGEAVSVGGRIDKAEGAVISGETQQIDIGTIGLPEIKWLREWFVQCVLKLRPLAPQVGWVWGVAGVMFALYFLIAIAFPRPVQACVDELVRRPATTFLFGILTKILAPFGVLILIATGVGVFVIPFLLAALFLFAVVGKIALLEGLGLQIGKQFGVPALQKPITAFLLGSIIIILLYMVPIVGLITWMILGLWGLGIAVSAAFGGLKRELPPKQPVFPTPMTVPAIPVAPLHSLTPNPGEAYANGPVSASLTPTTEIPPQTAVVPGPIPPPVMPEILAFPRAGFWERMGAAFLDLVIVVVLSAFVGGMPLGLLIALAYFTGMWTWKGTTIGGIVLGLKVVRVDGQPLAWRVALVRALAAAFSAFVIFLGFLWIAWDKEKQGWHDMIAGTVVLRLPRGMPLVCI
jgi:uncharacterized RDD family membrane protein YckC